MAGIPEVGTPERDTYNDARWGGVANKANRPVKGHPDRAEFETWREKSGSRSSTARKRASRDEYKEAEGHKAAAEVAKMYGIQSASPTNPTFSDKSDAPRVSVFEPESADKPVNKNLYHSDLLHNIGLRIDSHLDKHAGTFDDTEIRGKVDEGFRALNAHTDAHLGNDLTLAKRKIKESAEAFSQAHAMASKHINIPGVLVEGDPSGRAHNLGTLAVHASNAYINSKRAGFGGVADPGMGGADLLQRKPKQVKKKPNPIPEKDYAEMAKAGVEIVKRADVEAAKTTRDPNYKEVPTPPEKRASLRDAKYKEIRTATASRRAADMATATPAAPTKDASGFTPEQHDAAFESAHQHWFSNSKRKKAGPGPYRKSEAFIAPAKYMQTVSDRAAKRAGRNDSFNSGRGA